MRYVFLLFFIFQLSYSQSLEIKYYYNVASGNTSLSKLKSRPDYNWYTYTLKYNNGISLYTNDDFTKYLNKSYEVVDTLYTNGQYKSISYSATYLTEDLLESKKVLYYKNHLDKKFSLIHTIHSKSIGVEDNFMYLNYTLTNETKTILGYTCTKAVVKVGNMEEYYWFTDELGVAVSPNLSEGIPGVVLEIEGSSFNFLAYKITINDSSKLISKPVLPSPIYSYNDAMIEIQRLQREYLKKIKDKYPDFKIFTK